jgi:hypothetical protein
VVPPARRRGAGNENRETQMFRLIRNLAILRGLWGMFRRVRRR